MQNGAFASGVAGAVAGSSSLSQNNEKCLSGKCNLSGNLQPQSQSLLPSNNNDCASGQCIPSFSGNIPSKDGSEQENFNHGDSNSKNSENTEKSAYEGSDCAYGKCDANVNPNTASSGNDHDIFVPLSPSSNSALPKPQKPSVFLNTPSFGPACTSHNCNPVDSYSSGNLPSSYNVPILGTNPSLSNSASSLSLNQGSKNLYQPSSPAKFPATSPSCTDSNCGSSSPHAPLIPQQPSSCNGPYCAGSSVNNDVFNSNKHIGSLIIEEENKPTKISTSEQSPKQEPSSVYMNSYENNNNYNSVSPSPNNINLNSHPSQPSISLKPNLGSQSASTPTDSGASSLNIQVPKQDSPNYNNGFGGWAGNNNVHGSLSTQSDFGISYSNPKLQPDYLQKGPESIDSSNSNSAHVPTRPSIGSVTAAPYPTHITASLVPNQGFSHTPKNNGDINAPKTSPPNHNAPAYTGGFGGPSGFVNGNIGHSSPVASLGNNKPHLSVNLPAKESPVYTGGFGGPAGPIDTSFPANTKFSPKPDTVSSSAHNAEGNSYGKLPHSSSQPEIISQPSVSLSPPVQNPPTNVLPAMPSLFNNDDKTKLPSYSGGFGGPKGLLKPNEYNLPKKTHSSGSSSYNPLPCNSEACSTKDKNEATIGSHSINTAFASASASANAKAVAYSGGFGGPPGFLRPYDDKKHSKASHAGGIIDSPSGSSDIHVPTSGFGLSDKPLSPSFNQQFGAQANAGSQDNAGAHANAVAFANAGTFDANLNISIPGCRTGCESASNHENGNSFVHGNSQATSGTAGLNTMSGALAAAQSIVGANAGTLAAGRSYASSSASAHASAGIKGGNYLLFILNHKNNLNHKIKNTHHTC